ncbi:aminotransferase [Methylopila jiangsuensis]|uniref:Aminotransferase n=1 Tax=Methylopila jiangsuensis TaxID=586230 RepID=A0A9W6JID5_9HYPH|nr:aspartate aminotransferase family protein [Methylopila jiangsuensis]MDR6284817.1 4-aminobutyrate aminotransferase-like enzyme [Methylopila jiangsuensis]GLK77792.1 aminotransferase [Methylopila jiangsuensis]
MTAAASRKILALNAFGDGDAARLDPETAALVARRRRTFGPTSVLFYERPLHVARGEGVWLETADGTRYLDVYNNVPSVGHCNPRVVRAVAEQAATLNIHTRYLYDVVHTYAERLLATFPERDDYRAVFTCTGSESNDVALRLAAIATGRSGFVVTEGAYHGNTTAVAEVSPSSRPGKPLAPHVRAIPAPLAGDAAAAERFTADLEAAIASLKASGHGFAGLLVDTIFSSDGVAAEPAGFLKPAADAAHAAGGLVIADEVQPGFGRTGAHMWGFQRHGITPDVVTMGKPMGNGIPVGGVVAREALLQGFADSVGYFNTFGGNPVASAAALAVLDEIEERGLTAQAGAVGRHLLAGLESLKSRHPAIRAARGAGLYLGVEFADDAGRPDAGLTSRVINGLRDRRILIGAAGIYGAVLKIRPPLVFETSHADRLLEALDETLAAEG